MKVRTVSRHVSQGSQAVSVQVFVLNIINLTVNNQTELRYTVEVILNETPSPCKEFRFTTVPF